MSRRSTAASDMEVDNEDQIPPADPPAVDLPVLPPVEVTVQLEVPVSSQHSSVEDNPEEILQPLSQLSLNDRPQEEPIAMDQHDGAVDIDDLLNNEVLPAAADDIEMRVLENPPSPDMFQDHPSPPPNVHQADMDRDDQIVDIDDLFGSDNESRVSDADEEEEDLPVVPPPVIPIARRPVENGVDITHRCGDFDWECQNCGALYYRQELPVWNRNRIQYALECCAKGRFNLPRIGGEGERHRPIPNILQELITGQHELSAHFMSLIREYNSSLAFASFGADTTNFQGRYGTILRIHGQTYHRLSALQPPPNVTPTFGQLYIVDAAMANDFRLQNHPNLNPELLLQLDNTLREVNPFCRLYWSMHELEERDRAEAAAQGRQLNHHYLIIYEDHRDNLNRYNRPADPGEVGAIYTSIDGMPPAHRSVAVALRNDDQPRLTNIPLINRCLDPMIYPILFPHGDFGWSPNMALQRPRQRNNNISMREFYSYRLSIRRELGILHQSGKLFQQYCVDAWIKSEVKDLNFIRSHQAGLRSELYQGLMDHINNRANREGVNVGRMIILPSSFSGSPRNMQMLYQDSMAMVRQIGRPDLFVTVTTNPNWEEILQLLPPNTHVSDRPDLLARVFEIKLREFITDLTKNHIFGVLKGYMFTIEFQKRGLAHAHFLIILDENYKPRTIEILDQTVSAEIPDPVVESDLHALVETFMMHGPCGDYNNNAKCMRDGVCSKRFPKSFREESDPNIQSFDSIRRRDTGRTITKNRVDLDNRWVVGYNPYLLKKYNCHINVEVVSSFLHTIKYIYKYVYKGQDSARVALIENPDGEEEPRLDWDEARAFLDARYVSSVEAIWRLRQYNLHGRSHVIHRLPVHLENQQNVVFREGEEEEALDRNQETMLTAWFRLNHENRFNDSFQVYPRNLLYHQIPLYYTWKTPQRIWEERGDRRQYLSRINHVSPRDTERYYLRMLLLHVRGPTSYADLRTVDGVEYATFFLAAEARNLTADLDEWRRALQEAVNYQMPRQIRMTFASMIMYCELRDPHRLWMEFRNQMSEDYLHRGVDQEQAYLCALRDIARILEAGGINLRDLEGFGDIGHLDDEDIGVADPEFDVHHERRRAEETRNQLNVEQRNIHQAIIDSVYSHEVGGQSCFFIEGPAGTGKTFLYNSLLHHVRGQGDVAIGTAFTGIAATLLHSGSTMHSTFGFPLEVNETSTSFVRENSPKAEKLRSAKLIIMDEVTMMTKYHITIVDRLLKSLMNNHRLPFGGKTVLLGGDFRQTLPVMPLADRPTITSSTIKSAEVYRSLRKYTLETNMRTGQGEVEYAEYLLSVGNGTLVSANAANPNDRLIHLPPETVVEDIITSTFGPEMSPDRAHDYVEAAILCPKNVDTAEVNDQVLDRLVGQEHFYYSVDRIDDDVRLGDDQDPLDIPIEFLNDMNPPGMPPHKLRLKVGCIVMLLRNLNVSRGFVNGTRLKVTHLGNAFIDTVVLTGAAAGQHLGLTRFELSDSSNALPFNFKRRQFPIKVSYAMTINKAQGQTMSRVGLYLPAPVFSHGQLYVALSRVRNRDSLKVKVDNTERQGTLIEGDDRVYTPNVVWREVLD